MTSTTFDVSNMSFDQLQALQAMVAEQKKQLKDAETNALSSLLQPVADQILADVTEWQETDHWVGYKTFGIPVTHDGKDFTVSVTFTDVAAKEAKPKRTRKATPAEAEAEGEAPVADAPKGPAKGK